MKKTLISFMLVILVSFSFVACSSNSDKNDDNNKGNNIYSEENFTEDPLSGIWDVVEGGDDHTIIIANGNIQIIDGSDSVICKYTKPSDDVFKFEFDGESWVLKYDNGFLYRFENGEADGYVYKRTAYNSNK